MVQTFPAYGDSHWDGKGKIVPDHKASIRSLSRPATGHHDKNIPFYRIPVAIPGRQGQAPMSAQSVELPQTLATVSPSQGFSTPDTIDGLGYDGVTPPDVQVAAGPQNIMEMVNLQGEVWGKDGKPQGPPFDLSSFFGTGSDSISDPKIFYDSSSGRWFSSITDVSASTVKVAVSDTSDAVGNFCIYTLQGPSYTILDQPIIGASDDKFVISVNDFSEFTQQFQYSQYWVLNKSDMTSCSPASYVSKESSSYISIHPVQSLTGTRTEFMVSTDANSAGSRVYVFAVDGTPPNPVNVSVTTLPVSNISAPPTAAQKGTLLRLDTGDYRVQDAMWSDGMLWLAHDNACKPSGDAYTRSCLHLVEIDTGNGASGSMKVVQDFDYGISGKYLFYPALRETNSGSLFIVYGLSSGTDYPAVDVTEQASSDGRNSVEPPALLQQGNGAVSVLAGCLNIHGCRYGDYFGASIDPSDPTKVWVAGEYGSGTTDFAGLGKTWATKIGSLSG